MISSFAVHHVRSHMCQAFHALSSVIASTEAVKTHRKGGSRAGRSCRSLPRTLVMDGDCSAILAQLQAVAL
jgi:hypothetical protein